MVVMKDDIVGLAVNIGRSSRGMLLTVLHSSVSSATWECKGGLNVPGIPTVVEVISRLWEFF